MNLEDNPGLTVQISANIIVLVLFLPVLSANWNPINQRISPLKSKLQVEIIRKQRSPQQVQDLMKLDFRPITGLNSSFTEAAPAK